MPTGWCFLTLSYHRPVSLLLLHRRDHAGRGAAVGAVRAGAAEPLHRPRQCPVPAVAHTGETVSVLIPAYNEEKVIALTVERILASDYRNLEVLVIDDGSADHTAEVVRNRFAERTARHADLHSQWRQGQCAQYRLCARPPARWWWRWMPIPNSTPTPSRVWCAGSPIRKSARWRATPRSATAST